jgi:hypothetical protein
VKQTEKLKTFTWGSVIAIKKKKKLFFFVQLPPKDVDTRQIKVIEGELEILVLVNSHINMSLMGNCAWT